MAFMAALLSILYLSQFFFHFYNYFNAVTPEEKAQYFQVQRGLMGINAQIRLKTLRPHS
jgi:hypothetical protein